MTLLELLTQSNFTQLVYNFFLPFALTFVILWGALSLTRLFSRRINLVIALVITLFFANTEQFATLTSLLSQYTGAIAVGTFFLVFIFGIVRYGIGRGQKLNEKYKSTSEKLKDIDKRIAELEKQINAAKSEEQEMTLRRELRELKERRKDLLDKEY